MAHYCTPRHMPHAPFTSFGNAKSFDLTLVSVHNLQRCERVIGQRIRVYAELQLDGSTVKKTDTHLAADGTTSTLNFSARYSIAELTGRNLVVRLYYKRSVGHSSIGEVKINVRRLFDGWRDSRQNAETFQLPKAKGRLNIAYRFA